jgi:hypothetical protein
VEAATESGINSEEVQAAAILNEKRDADIKTLEAKLIVFENDHELLQKEVEVSKALLGTTQTELEGNRERVREIEAVLVDARAEAEKYKLKLAEVSIGYLRTCFDFLFSSNVAAWANIAYFLFDLCLDFVQLEAAATLKKRATFELAAGPEEPSMDKVDDETEPDSKRQKNE